MALCPVNGDRHSYCQHTFVPQDPDEDEETRQYRLKIEEQKRLREEILKKKELRRQMQAGVRKKELLERLNSHPNTPSQNPSPTQTQLVQQNQLTPHPVQQRTPPQQQQAEQKEQQQLEPQQQRPFPQRTQQSSNQPLKNPRQGTLVPPNGATQEPIPRPNVKTRLQMFKGSTQQQQSPGPVQDPQWNRPEQSQQPQQQRRNSALQSVNRPGTPIQSTQKNIPVTPSVVPGQAQVQNQGPKPGAKRTVMQRTKTSSAEGQQVPHKVRVVKLSGAVSVSFLLLLNTHRVCSSNIYVIPWEM